MSPEQSNESGPEPGVHVGLAELRSAVSTATCACELGAGRSWGGGSLGELLLDPVERLSDEVLLDVSSCAAGFRLLLGLLLRLLLGLLLRGAFHRRARGGFLRAFLLGLDLVDESLDLAVRLREQRLLLRGRVVDLAARGVEGVALALGSGARLGE